MKEPEEAKPVSRFLLIFIGRGGIIIFDFWCGINEILFFIRRKVVKKVYNPMAFVPSDEEDDEEEFIPAPVYKPVNEREKPFAHF